MTYDPREWWEIKRDSCGDAENLYYLVPVVCEESRSRFKYEVVKALEGMIKEKIALHEKEEGGSTPRFAYVVQEAALEDAIEMMKKL